MNWLTQPLSWPDGAALSAALHTWRDGAWREWPVWPVRWLVASAAFLFVFGAFGMWLVWSSSDQDMDGLILAHQALKAQVQTQRQRMSTFKSQSSTVADQTQALSAAQRAWPTPELVQPVLMDLHLQAQQQGLKVVSFKPESALSSHGFAVQPLNLRLRGSFAQLVAWSDAVFQRDALWVPEKWTLTAQSDTPSEGQVSLDAVLHLYVRSDESRALQALAMNTAHGESEAAPAPFDPPSPRLDPFSRPAQPAKAPSSSPPWGHDAPPLRRYPLTELTMVGSFSSSGVPNALVQTPAGLFHVAIGDVLGVEGAQVVGLDDTQLKLRMRVKPVNGLWTERQDVLSIRQIAKP